VRGSAPASSAAEKQMPGEILGQGLDFVERFGDEAGEALFNAGLAMIDQAVGRAREGVWGRWRFYPRGEVRKLRRDIARALRMIRQAQLLQEQISSELRDLTYDLTDRARAAGRNGDRGEAR
jgi:hypothetical protein